MSIADILFERRHFAEYTTGTANPFESHHHHPLLTKVISTKRKKHELWMFPRVCHCAHCATLPTVPLCPLCHCAHCDTVPLCHCANYNCFGVFSPTFGSRRCCTARFHSNFYKHSICSTVPLWLCTNQILPVFHYYDTMISSLYFVLLTNGIKCINQLSKLCLVFVVRAYVSDLNKFPRFRQDLLP